MGQKGPSGLPVKKATEFKANSPLLILPFTDTTCDGSHENEPLHHGKAEACQLWTWDMSNRVLDDSSTGGERFWRELAAFALSPVSGLDRMFTGKAWKMGAPGLRPPLALNFRLGADGPRDRWMPPYAGGAAAHRADGRCADGPRFHGSCRGAAVLMEAHAGPPITDLEKKPVCPIVHLHVGNYGNPPMGEENYLFLDIRNCMI